MKIHSPGAFSINLKFDRFHLPDSAELYIFNEEQTMVMGPITSKLNKRNKGLATDLIQGNTIVLELFEPAGHFGETELHISRVVHGYKNMFGGGFNIGYGDSAPCHNDVNCPVGEDWQDEAAAVAMVLVDETTRACSGAMINNACQDFTPNFLTAFHCLDLDPNVGNGNRVIDPAEENAIENDWVFRFQYMSPSCNGPDDTQYFSFNGATLVADNEPTDALLIQLDDLPTGDMGINLAGWNRGAAAATSSAGIHHPQGDVMKISIENDPATAVVPFFGTVQNHWEVFFDDRIHEDGSSGSPLFDQNHRVVGQLTGNQNGITGCDEPDAIYGMLAVSWNAGFNMWLTNDPAVVTTDLISIPFIPEPTDVVVCNTNRTFDLDNAPPTATHDVAWSTTSNLTLVSSGQDFVTVRYAGSGNGIGTITATVSNVNTGLCPVARNFTRDVQAGPFWSAQITVSGTAGVCNGTEYTYTANVPFGHKPGYSYTWTYPGNWIFVSQYDNVIRLRTPLYETPDGGTVRVSVDNGCGASGFSGITVYPIGCGGFSIATSSSVDAELFKLYPNPSSGTLTIEQTNQAVDIGPYSTELYNYSGKKLTTISTSDSQVNLNTRNLPDGHYVLKIIYKDGILIRRIVIVKE